MMERALWRTCRPNSPVLANPSSSVFVHCLTKSEEPSVNTTTECKSERQRLALSRLYFTGFEARRSKIYCNRIINNNDSRTRRNYLRNASASARPGTKEREGSGHRDCWTGLNWTGLPGSTSRLVMKASRHTVTTLAKVEMPCFLYGCAWKKDRTAELVVQAVVNGFRGIDVACQPKHYNEAGVGEALRRLDKEHGIPRSAVFLQTKFTSVDGQDPNTVPYDASQPLAAQVRQSFHVSKTNLGVDRIDSLVLHSPMRTMQDTLTVWHEFEKLHDEGGVRQLGISNCYDLSVLQGLHEVGRVKPAVVQNRFYPATGYDVDIRRFCKTHGIFYQSFWTLTGNPHVLRSSVVRAIAKRENLDPEQVFYRYCLDADIIVLNGTTQVRNMKADMDLLNKPSFLTLVDVQGIEATMGV